MLRRLGAQPSLADDMAQDAFVIAFERIDSFRNEGPFGAWINRIAARLYVKRWRADAKTELFADPSDYADSPAAHHQGDSIDLDRALQSLSKIEQVCVSLCHGVGMTHAEIANELEMPIGTVKSHIKRGLDKIENVIDGKCRSTGASMKHDDFESELNALYQQKPHVYDALFLSRLERRLRFGAMSRFLLLATLFVVGVVATLYCLIDLQLAAPMLAIANAALSFIYDLSFHWLVVLAIVALAAQYRRHDHKSMHFIK